MDWLNSMFQKILLLIDAVVYWFVSMCYQLFVRMATLQLFNDAFFGEFANRIYAILGVFMLFYLAYALLNALIDPEKFTGDKGVSKIATNLVISLILLGLTPTIFDYAYRLQNYILSSNILGAIILNSSTTDVNSGQEAMTKFGDSFSFTVMNTFINPDNYNVKMRNDYDWWDYKKDVLENSDYLRLPDLSEAIVYGQVDKESGKDVQVTYYVVISTAAGIFMCYMILSFTIDLGIRVFKFAFCQLLAPIPIIMRAMPGKKSTFDKWLKLTLSVFFEVFIRVAVMYLAVYFIKEIYLNWRWENFSGIQGKLALAIVIMGIFAFAKQAPKMLSDILGIESGNLKLGIGEKLKAGGFFGMTSAAGAFVTSRGNPFAVARAWRAGNKDGNFESIGREAMHRRDILRAKAQGSNWLDRRLNDIRRSLGYDTTADAYDRRIDELDYINPNTGRRMTTEEVQQMKEQHAKNLNAIGQLNDTIRGLTNTIEKRNNIRTEAEKQIGKVDNTLVDSVNGAYGSFTGNYSQLSDFVTQLEQAGPQNGMSATQHAGIIASYKAALNTAKENLRDQFINDVINGTLTNSVITDNVNQLNADLASGAVQTSTVRSVGSAADIQTVFRAASNENSTNSFQKYQYELENAEIDRIEAERKERQEMEKQSTTYVARDASRRVSRGGGKSKT